MRKTGILNPELAARINRLGHTDTWVIADCGLPIPREVPVIDLTLVFGIPTFHQVVEAMLQEVVVEAVTIADSTPAQIRDAMPDVPVTDITHEQLKALVAGASFVIRTGETTAFANAIFHSGVPF